MGRGTGRGRARDRCCPGLRVAEELARASDMAASLAGKRPFGAGERRHYSRPNLYSKTNVRRDATGLWKVWKGESGGAGSLPSVFVLQPDDVIDLRGGHFEELTLLHSDHPMLAPRNDPARHAGGQSVRLQLAPVVLQLQVHGPLDDQQRLVLLPVILKAEHFPRVDVDHLAEVLVGDREAVFPAPGLLDNVRQVGAARAFLRARRAAGRPAPSRT